MLANTSPQDGTGQGTARARNRLSAVERRAAIIEAAIERFALHGFRGTTTRELAAAAGVSEPVLYQHFATKRDLYTAIVDYLIEQAHERFDARAKQLEPAATDREFLQWLGESILAYHAEDPRRIRLLIFSALEGHELADLWFEKATLDFIRWVEKRLEQRIAAGTIRGESPGLLARAFIFMVSHFAFTNMLFPGRCTPGPDAALVSRLVDLFLNGIAVKEQDCGSENAKS